MALDLTAYDAVLKTYYRDIIISLLNKQLKLTDLFNKKGAEQLSVDGRNVVYVVHRSRNVGVGAVAESGTLPTAGNQGTSNVTVPDRYNYGRIQLTAQTIKHSKTSKGAFAQAMTFEIRHCVEDLARAMEIQLFGFGVGIRCRVNGSQGSSATINVKDPYGVPGNVGAARLLQVGDIVAFVRNATPTSATDADIQGTNKTISSIATDLSSITFSGVTGVSLNDGDMVVMSPSGSAATSETSVNKETMGLLGMIDDGTYLPTLHGVSRASVPRYNSFVYNLNNGNMDSQTMERMEDATDERGGPIDTVISHHSVKREYTKQLINAKRFINEYGQSPDAGFAGRGGLDKDLEFNGHPWKVMRACPYGTVFGINKEYNVHFEWSPGEWADDDGKILLRVSNQDSYEARFRKFGNFHNDKPNSSFRLDNVAATVDLVGLQ